ncbi:MAG TPA: surface-adhesin E family protein [Candidatus Sulfotelmatobacter sp.]|nr:surface-adhesin E family protein [Candidatus Sulfotelmatobacter sp.]
MKKSFVIIVAALFAPILIVTLVMAAGDWRPIGETATGDKVFVSAVRVQKKNQRSALVRVEYKQPTRLPLGGPFVEMRARVRINCANGQAIPTSEWFYTRDRSGRIVVNKKASHDDQFGKPDEGGFVEMVRKNVCAQTK